MYNSGHVNSGRVSAVTLLTKTLPSHAQYAFDCSEVTREHLFGITKGTAEISFYSHTFIPFSWKFPVLCLSRQKKPLLVTSCKPHHLKKHLHFGRRWGKRLSVRLCYGLQLTQIKQINTNFFFRLTVYFAMMY